MELTLTELAASAEIMGLRPGRTGLGGNTVGILLDIEGVEAIVTVGDCVESGDEWVVGLDGEWRDRVESMGHPFDSGFNPVTGDADQTLRDAIAWVRHAVWGDALDADA